MRVKNVLQYLETTARALPDKVAFSLGAGEESLTFEQLLRGARRIGSALCHRGLTGKRVAVWMERRPSCVMAMLGAVYAGACYVPLDAAMATPRIAHAIESAQVELVICDEPNRQAALIYGRPVVLWDELLVCPEDDAALSQLRAAQIDVDPVYIVFTSGSTGKPKGVVGTHRAVIDYGEALTRALGLDGSCVFGCQSPLYFDAPLKEILTTLMYGATTYLIPRRLFSFPVPLMEYLNACGVNTVCWVSSALSTVATLGALEACPPTCLRTVVFGSEALPVKHLQAWRAALPKATFWQLYGPTEATGMSCYFRVDRDFEAGSRIPIGRPLDNTGLFLLDEDGALVLPCAGERSRAGEIYLRGSCLCAGYDHDSERTKECFVQNPLHSAYPEAVYRTGDLAEYNERGELEFIGRRDGQIKRMGHRIELGEIEAAACTLPEVASAACVVQTNGQAVLFYTGQAEGQEVAAALLRLLPRYFVPSDIRRLKQLPKTDNGKVDRCLLSTLEAEE